VTQATRKKVPAPTQAEATALAEEAAVTQADQAKKEHADKLKEDLDSILDEIDEVLEENAATFVREYVQKGGE